jgi:large subunit ribosomal protein L32
VALPKRRKSKAKSKKHRTHWKLSKPNLSFDSREDEYHLPHRISPKGTYKGIQYAESEE